MCESLYLCCDLWFFFLIQLKKICFEWLRKRKRRVRIANKPRQSELEMIRRSIYRRDVKPEHKHLRSRIKLERVHSSIESTNPRQSLQWSSLTSRKTEKKHINRSIDCRQIRCFDVVVTVIRCVLFFFFVMRWFIHCSFPRTQISSVFILFFLNYKLKIIDSSLSVFSHMCVHSFSIHLANNRCCADKGVVYG